MKLRIPFRAARKIFKVDKKFETKAKLTKRTAKVAEAFGLGVDEAKTFAVLEGLKVDVDPGDIVYITGESGGGKSVLLNALCEEIEKHPEFGGVARDRNVRIDPDEVLVEGVGRDVHEALTLLSHAGLNEAFLFLRRYRELSDGQKYRYRIAKLLDSGKGVWAMDEFCSTLDRATAKAVAYNVRRAARRWGKTLIAATAHGDLLRDLDPNVHIIKKFGREVEVRYLEPANGPCSLLDELEIAEGSLEDYKRLEQFHYRAGRPGFVKKVYVARVGGELAGAIVYGPTYPALKGRGIALPQFKRKVTREHVKEINEKFIRIWRVVVAPKFRGLGLGTRLVEETMPLLNYPYVEALAVMGRIHPFFERAGMVRVDPPADEKWLKVLEELRGLGFEPELLPSRKRNLAVIRALTPEKIEKLKRILARGFFAAKLFREWGDLPERVERGDPEAMAEALTRIKLEPVYYVWKNPAFPNLPDPRR